MLTKEQILEADEEAGETPNTKHQTPKQPITQSANSVELTQCREVEKLPITTALELEAVNHLSTAIHFIKSDSRPAARQSISQAIDKLNEAEIDD